MYESTKKHVRANDCFREVVPYCDKHDVSDAAVGRWSVGNLKLQKFLVVVGSSCPPETRTKRRKEKKKTSLSLLVACQLFIHYASAHDISMLAGILSVCLQGENASAKGRICPDLNTSHDGLLSRRAGCTRRCHLPSCL